MMKTYDNNKADVVARVRDENKKFHHVDNWPKVLQDATIARASREL